MSCDKVTKQGMKITFTIGKEGKHNGYQITIDIDKWLLKDEELGLKSKGYCYLPIFITDPSNYPGVFTKWFLGNMFLDKYLVVHDYDITQRMK